MNDPKLEQMRRILEENGYAVTPPVPRSTPARQDLDYGAGSTFDPDYDPYKDYSPDNDH